jgi:hypothetical protein
MNIMGKIRCRHSKRRGMTLLEVIIAGTIGMMVAAFISFMIIITARAQAVIIPQIRKQQAAVRAAQVIGDLLRNASHDSITIVDQNTIEFQSSEQSDADIANNVYQKIQFQGGIVRFWPDKTVDNSRVIAKELENVIIEWDQVRFHQIIDVAVVFKYRKYRGYNASEAERLNGTFRTEIYPRNR